MSKNLRLVAVTVYDPDMPETADFFKGVLYQRAPGPTPGVYMSFRLSRRRRVEYLYDPAKVKVTEKRKGGSYALEFCGPIIESEVIPGVREAANGAQCVLALAPLMQDFQARHELVPRWHRS